MSKSYQLNLKGLKCPIPVLRANKILKNYSKNTIVEIKVDDPAAPQDFKILCDTKNYTILSVNKKNNHSIIKIKI